MGLGGKPWNSDPYTSWPEVLKSRNSLEGFRVYGLGVGPGLDVESRHYFGLTSPKGTGQASVRLLGFRAVVCTFRALRLGVACWHKGLDLWISWLIIQKPSSLSPSHVDHKPQDSDLQSSSPNDF